MVSSQSPRGKQTPHPRGGVKEACYGNWRCPKKTKLKQGGPTNYHACATCRAHSFDQPRRWVQVLPQFSLDKPAVEWVSGLCLFAALWQANQATETHILTKTPADSVFRMPGKVPGDGNKIAASLLTSCWTCLHGRVVYATIPGCPCSTHRFTLTGGCQSSAWTILLGIPLTIVFWLPLNSTPQTTAATRAVTQVFGTAQWSREKVWHVWRGV